METPLAPPVEQDGAVALGGEALEELARKYVWWQPPSVTLARREHFLCQLMTLGTEEDVRHARNLLGDAALIDALEQAPPGVMDSKSWNFWHLFFHRTPVPPLPIRPTPDALR